jgi:hypothetical protein
MHKHPSLCDLRWNDLAEERVNLRQEWEAMMKDHWDLT